MTLCGCTVSSKVLWCRHKPFAHIYLILLAQDLGIGLLSLHVTEPFCTGAVSRSTRAEQDEFDMDGFEEISGVPEALPALPQPMVYPAYQQVSLPPL